MSGCANTISRQICVQGVVASLNVKIYRIVYLSPCAGTDVLGRCQSGIETGVRRSYIMASCMSRLMCRLDLSATFVSIPAEH